MARAFASALRGWYDLAITKQLQIMTESRLSQLAAAIDELSLSEQLWLMERLVQRIRKRSVPCLTLNDDEFERMARDPGILRELKEIETEFEVAEFDGLDHRSRSLLPASVVGLPSFSGVRCGTSEGRHIATRGRRGSVLLGLVGHRCYVAMLRFRGSGGGWPVLPEMPVVGPQIADCCKLLQFLGRAPQLLSARRSQN